MLKSMQTVTPSAAYLGKSESEPVAAAHNCLDGVAEGASKSDAAGGTLCATGWVPPHPVINSTTSSNCSAESSRTTAIGMVSTKGLALAYIMMM
jgi:hypothetical protein